MIKVYASVQEMDSLRGEWNDMYDKAGSVTPFQSFDAARGMYPYKMHNFKPAVGSLTRLHWSRSYTGKVADLLECLVSQIKRMKRTR